MPLLAHGACLHTHVGEAKSPPKHAASGEFTSGAMQWRPWRVLLSRSQSSQKASGQPTLHATPFLFRIKECSRRSLASAALRPSLRAAHPSDGLVGTHSGRTQSRTEPVWLLTAQCANPLS